MTKPTACDCGSQHPTGQRFYVSVIDGGRRGLLLGPFATHAAALARVNVVRSWCIDRDQRAHWYGFGTAGMAPPAGAWPRGTLAAHRAALRAPCRLPDRGAA
jgi:hypothetical protein